jgi:hypothetical protein
VAFRETASGHGGLRIWIREQESRRTRQYSNSYAFGSKQSRGSYTQSQSLRVLIDQGSQTPKASHNIRNI